MRSYILAVLAVVGVVMAFVGCDSGKIIDNWGPPAGYATVSGSVRTAAGNAMPGARVLMSRCTNPIGYVGGSVADATGAYMLAAHLAPVGIAGRVDLDTLRVRCEALVNGAVVDSIEMHFTSDAGAPAQNTLDLIVRS